MTDPAQTRIFRESDLDESTRLFLDVFSAEPWNDRWPSYDSARKHLEEFVNTPGFLGILAVDGGGAIIGVMFGHVNTWWKGPQYFINEFGVGADAQNRGVGTAMLRRLESELAKMGVHFVSALTDRNVPALKFYEKMGFQASEKTVFVWKRIDDAAG
jgi:aminoglycoside 6'-N-acetyltransferase I